MRPLQPGLQLRGYTLEARLGGGMDGEVWRVVGPSGEALALKARARRAPDAASFRREYERLRTLRLPGVIRVRQFAEDQGYLFFTMDLAEGVPFDTFVQKGKTCLSKVRRAATAGAALALSLAAIHRLGLAHRDLKPSNILVREDGQPTLLDFGIAESRGGSSRVRVGTAAYMAPEVRLGFPSDHRADSYALGVMLYESLAGRPGEAPPGRPRPPLALDPSIPLSLSNLVDQAMQLDPAERPESEAFAKVLSAIVEGRAPSVVPWPSPVDFVGDPASLLAGSAVVVGPYGSGRRRLVQEARYQWYRRGYRSVAGQSAPEQPLGALRQVLSSLLAGMAPAEQQRLLGADAQAVQAILPGPQDNAWPPATKAISQSLANVLGRAAPIAVAIWDADHADVGTAAVLPLLAKALPSDVRLWLTSGSPIPGLRRLEPGRWGSQTERTVLSNMLPASVHVPNHAVQTPLEGVAKVWRVMAGLRGLSGPAHPVPRALRVLSLLEEPFLLPLAELLTDGCLREMLSTGHIQVTGQTATFTDAGTRALARAACKDVARAHQCIAETWARLPIGRQDPAAIARHVLLAGLPPRKALQAAVHAALLAGLPAEADRWLRLLDLYEARQDDFLTAYARAWVDLSLRPTRLSLDTPEKLRASAADPEQYAMVDALQLMAMARKSSQPQAIRLGKTLAARHCVAFPLLAAEILREVAAAELSCGDAREAVRSGREALALVDRERAQDPTPERRDVEIVDTIAAALLADNRPEEAIQLCSQTAARCYNAQQWWGEATARTRLARGQYALGQRADADDNAARARRLQPRHSDPSLLSRCGILQARLSIERGELRQGQADLDAARTAARMQGATALLAEACALSLEVAVQRASRQDAQDAQDAYRALGGSHPLDHWPAVLGRWLWLAGDLRGALAAVRASREGYAALCVRAEQARLLLVSGQYHEANRAAGALTRRAADLKMEELALFGRLIAGAAIGERDATFNPLLRRTERSRWVHLYLGSIHLDAVRRRIRGENVLAVLKDLHARAEGMQHKLYLALSRPSGW